jgi:6,7-dimethyl-8-ribityllumazine synthase
MIKSIHIGRYARKSEEFRALVEFFEAIGFDRVEGHDAKARSVIFSVPLGLLSINSLSPEYPPEVISRLKDVAKLIVIEVSNPDTVFQIAKTMKLRVLADSASAKTGERNFSLELPGEIAVTVYGKPAEQPVGIEGKLDATGKRFGIVVGRFNSFITERLLQGALDGLLRSGARREDVNIVRVPGSFEIPSAARALAQTGKYDAVICLGCLLRGETAHYDVIANEVTRGIGQSAQETGVPHAFGVLTCDTLEQAIDRAGLKGGNKGFEAALAAVEMVSLKTAVSRQSSGKTAIGRRSSVVGKSKGRQSHSPRPSKTRSRR